MFLTRKTNLINPNIYKDLLTIYLMNESYVKRKYDIQIIFRTGQRQINMLNGINGVYVYLGSIRILFD